MNRSAPPTFSLVQPDICRHITSTEHDPTNNWDARDRTRSGSSSKIFFYVQTRPGPRNLSRTRVVKSDWPARFPTLLFMMHKQSTRDNPRIARYTSMTRRRHLGTNIMHDCSERFIKHRHNVDEIRAAQDNLSQTNLYSISSTDFDKLLLCTGWSQNHPRSSVWE